MEASCPRCKRAIGLAKILSIVNPWDFPCAGCSARLRITGLTQTLYVAVLAAAAGVGGWWIAMVPRPEKLSWALPFLGGSLGAALVVAIVCAARGDIAAKG